MRSVTAGALTFANRSMFDEARVHQFRNAGDGIFQLLRVTIHADFELRVAHELRHAARVRRMARETGSVVEYHGVFHARQRCFLDRGGVTASALLNDGLGGGFGEGGPVGVVAFLAALLQRLVTLG